MGFVQRLISILRTEDQRHNHDRSLEISMSIALDLYTTAKFLGLNPDLRSNRMQCPCGCDLNKKSYNWATASYFKDNFFECFRCGQKGTAWDLAQMRGLDENTLPQVQTRIETHYKKHQPLNLNDAWEQLHSLTDPDLIKKWSTEIRGFPKALEEIISQIPEIAHIGKFTPEGDAGELFRTAKYYDRLLLLPIFDPAGNIISIKFLWNGQGEIGERAKAINLQSSKCPEKPSGTPRIFGNLPEAISDAGNSTLYITEGGPDFFALKLTLLYSTGKAPVVGADSVSDLVKIAKGLVKDFEDKLERPNIVIVPHRGDQNKIGEKKALEAAKILAKTTNVKIAELPEELGEKADLADCLKTLGIDAVLNTLRNAERPKEISKYIPTVQKKFDSAQQFRTEFPDIIKSSFDDVIKDSLKVVATSTSPGLGKTSTSIEELVKWANKEKASVAYIAPTHKLLLQVKEQLENLNINVVHTLGRKSLREACLNSDASELADLLGISSNKICLGCQRGPKGSGDYCEYYQRLFEAATAGPGTIILMTTDQFYFLLQRKINFTALNESRSVLENVEMIVIDECPEHEFTLAKTIGRSQDPITNKNIDGSLLFRGEFPRPARELAEILYELMAPTPDRDIIQSSARLQNWYDTKKPQQVQGEALRGLITSIAVKKLGSRQHWKDLLEEVKKLVPGTNRDEEDHQITIRSLPAWLIQFAQALTDSPHLLMIQRFPNSETSKKKHEAFLHIYNNLQILPPEDPEQTPLPSFLILDAYLESNISNWQQLLPKHQLQLKIFKVDADKQKVRVKHIKLPTSRKALDNEEKFLEAVEATKRELKQIKGDSIIYTHKKNSKKVEETFDLPVDYYGRAQGINDYKSLNIILFGEARPNEAGIKAKIFARTEKEPNEKQVKERSKIERQRILMEASYRSRPLDAPEGGLTILVVSGDSPPPNLIDGIEVEPLKNFKQQKLEELVKQIVDKTGWIPSFNSFSDKTDEKKNNLSKLDEVYKDTIIISFTQLVETVKISSERVGKKVFSEVSAGFRRVRIKGFGDIFVSGSKEKQAETVQAFCFACGFESPKWVEKSLQDSETNLSVKDDLKPINDSFCIEVEESDVILGLVCDVSCDSDSGKPVYIFNTQPVDGSFELFIKPGR